MDISSTAKEILDRELSEMTSDTVYETFARNIAKHLNALDGIKRGSTAYEELETEMVRLYETMIVGRVLEDNGYKGDSGKWKKIQ